MSKITSRLLGSVVTLHRGEATTAWLMFAYSFLAMTSYNILRPITKSKAIDSLGAFNLPYLDLVAFVVIALLMHGYSRASRRLARSAIIPVTQVGLLVVILGFWLLFRAELAWAPRAFYVFGRILGILLISQFWTLANDLYDPRQARRVFGFIGGGASLGGLLGGSITATLSGVGTTNLLPLSAAILGLCIVLVSIILKRGPITAAPAPAAETRGVGAEEAVNLLRRSRHLQVIAFVIGFAALGATIIDLQLNMAADELLSSEGAIASFLGWVTVYLSAVGFVVQVGLVSRIHQSLGLTFALLLLPLSLGATALVILSSAVLWAPAAARVLDTTMRYTVDKTTREVLFLPLSADVKYRAKPFVDVTVDRFAKAIGALVLLVLVQPWGLALDWVRLSYASLVIMGLWMLVALVARGEYVRAFRQRLGTRDMEVEAVRFDVAEASTIQTLVDETANPDAASVLYAIDMLETLDQRDRISPLLLNHTSPAVRARALAAVDMSSTHAEQWLPATLGLLADPDAGVRAAAVRAQAVLRGEEAAPMLRGLLGDAEPRVVVTAVAELADSGRPHDEQAAETALARLIDNPRAEVAAARRDAAVALARIKNPAFRSLLIPLIHDRDANVASAAITSACAIGPSDALFMPALVSRLGHRVLKSAARETLVSYGDDVIDFLTHVLADRDEDAWVRRHVPATLARIPSQRSMDALFAALADPDGFLRFKVIAAVGTLRRDHPSLAFSADAVERLVVAETARYYLYLSLRHNLDQGDRDDRSLLVLSLSDKLERTLDRIFRLLGLLLPWEDVAAARRVIDHGTSRTRADGLEYLDNLLNAAMRKRVMPILDDAPIDAKVRHANSLLKSRPRDVNDTLAQLIHEADPVVAAAAIHVTRRLRLVEVLHDDMAHVLARRSADALVYEAATWALASGDGGLPVVDVADRLRTIPLFGFVSVDELFRVAATATQVRHRPDVELYRQGAAACEVLFLLEGSVEVDDGDPAPATVNAPAALNFADMLGGRPLRSTVRTSEPVVGLTLGASDFLTMLSDNILAARGLFRMLLASPRAFDEMTIAAAGTPAGGPSGPGLEPVEVARLLRQNPVFERATVDQLRDLVAVTQEVRLTSGDVLLGGDTPPAMFYILEGEIQLDSGSGPPAPVGAGATVGVVETLTGGSPTRRAVVSRDGRALKLAHDVLFDVLADRSDLLQGVFGGVLSVTAVAFKAGGP